MHLSLNRVLHITALLSLGAVGIALVSQHVFDMRPCAWCVFQRLLFLVIAALCWAGVFLSRYTPVLARLSGLLVAGVSVGGIVAAWYQYTVASHMFSCDMTFADRFMFKSGLDGALPWLFGIFASCMDARVELMGVEYALWGLGLFVVTGLLGLAAIVVRSR